MRTPYKGSVIVVKIHRGSCSSHYYNANSKENRFAAVAAIFISSRFGFFIVSIFMYVFDLFCWSNGDDHENDCVNMHTHTHRRIKSVWSRSINEPQHDQPQLHPFQTIKCIHRLFKETECERRAKTEFMSRLWRSGTQYSASSCVCTCSCTRERSIFECQGCDGYNQIAIR